VKRKDAEALLGSRVSVWTAMNGEYVGTLVDVVGSPWRAKVQITGVLAPAAFEWSRGSRQRPGFRPGQVVEVGGASVRPTADPGTTYEQALRVAAEVAEASAATAGPRDVSTLLRVAAHYRGQL